MTSRWLVEPSADGEERATRWLWRPAAALLLLHMALVWFARAPGLLTRQDDARYLLLARALAQGTYRDVLWVDAPWHHLYPPGYPLLLAGWRAIGGEAFDWMIGLQLLLSALSLALLFDAARRRLVPAVAITALLLAAINPHVIDWSAQVASEPSLMCCLAIAVWASVVLRGGARTVALVVAACAAQSMRSAGIIAPAAVLILLAGERRWRHFWVAGALIAPVAGLLLWWTLNDPHPVLGSSYAADLTAPVSQNEGFLETMLVRVRDNSTYYLLRGIPTQLSAPTTPQTVADNVVIVLTLVAGLAAGLWVAVQRLRMAAWCMLGTFGMLAVWSWQDGRYLVPIVPIILLVLVLGTWRLGAVRSPAMGIALLALLSVALGTSSLHRLRHRIQDRWPCDRSADLPNAHCVDEDQRGFFAATRFVRDSLPMDARILSAKSEPLALYSGHVTQPYQRWRWLEAAELRDSARAKGVGFVLLSNLQNGEAAGLAPRLEAQCAQMELVRAFPPRTLLLRWRTGPSAGEALTVTGPDSLACAALRRHRADPVVRRVLE